MPSEEKSHPPEVRAVAFHVGAYGFDVTAVLPEILAVEGVTEAFLRCGNKLGIRGRGFDSATITSLLHSKVTEGSRYIHTVSDEYTYKLLFD